MVDLGIATVGSIVVLCFLLGQLMKATPLDNRWIPVICGGFGIGLGILAFYLQIPDSPANDPITAAAVGAVSGFAATGINQIYKQLGDSNTGSDENSDKSNESDE